MKNVKITKNTAETEKWGVWLAHRLVGGNMVFLIGEMGSGKTVFVRGLARGLGIRECIISPTFVLVRTFSVRRHATIRFLCHADEYRLTSARDLDDTGLLECASRSDTIACIENPHRMLRRVGAGWIVRFTVVDVDRRRISITRRRAVRSSPHPSRGGQRRSSSPLSRKRPARRRQ